MGNMAKRSKKRGNLKKDKKGENNKPCLCNTNMAEKGHHYIKKMSIDPFNFFKCFLFYP